MSHSAGTIIPSRWDSCPSVMGRLFYWFSLAYFFSELFRQGGSVDEKNIPNDPLGSLGIYRAS